MKWKELLGKAAYWSKWLLLGFCVGHTYLTLFELSTSSTVLVAGTTVILAADWLSKQRV